MLLLAMSCFQGRTQDQAFDALLLHQPHGIQLTPGNLPSEGFERRVRAYAQEGGQVRLHHGFTWRRYRAAVYGPDGEPRFTEANRSLHPPRSVCTPKARGKVGRAWSFEEWLPIALRYDLTWETMIPSWVLGTGSELERAMQAGLRLAVDVSHLHIQRCQGVLDSKTLRRVFDYDKVAEIHVSQNNGRSDQHHPIHEGTPYLDWVRERMSELPVILESYWHHVGFDDQRQQVELLAAYCSR